MFVTDAKHIFKIRRVCMARTEPIEITLPLQLVNFQPPQSAVSLDGSIFTNHTIRPT